MPTMPASLTTEVVGHSQTPSAPEGILPKSFAGSMNNDCALPLEYAHVIQKYVTSERLHSSTLNGEEIITPASVVETGTQADALVLVSAHRDMLNGPLVNTKQQTSSTTTAPVVADSEAKVSLPRASFDQETLQLQTVAQCETSTNPSSASYLSSAVFDPAGVQSMDSKVPQCFAADPDFSEHQSFNNSDLPHYSSSTKLSLVMDCPAASVQCVSDKTDASQPQPFVQSELHSSYAPVTSYHSEHSSSGLSSEYFYSIQDQSIECKEPQFFSTHFGDYKTSNNLDCSSTSATASCEMQSYEKDVEAQQRSVSDELDYTKFTTVSAQPGQHIFSFIFYIY